jgi:selenoprotein W-related protein
MKEVVITYCGPCGYERRAKTAAAALQKELGVEATLKAGTGGVFHVRVGDEIVAARTKSHFPDSEHIVEAVSKSLNRAER